MTPSIFQQARDLADKWVVSNPKSRRLEEVILGTCGLVLARWLAWDGGSRVSMVGVLADPAFLCESLPTQH